MAKQLGIIERLDRIEKRLNGHNTRVETLETIRENNEEIKRYIALITQSGVAAPTVDAELENSLEGTPVWSYDGVGQYYLTLAGVFTEDKTIVFIGSDGSGGSGQVHAYWTDENTIWIDTLNDDGTVPSNGVLNSTSIMIIVYP